MANEPTIITASLSDDKLKESINNLVKHVNEGMETILAKTNSTVDAMEKKLKSLGNLKIDTGGSADGGSSKRAKVQNAETEAVEKSIVARDKQIKKNKEVEMSFDQMAAAQQKATRLPSEMRMPDMAKSARESFQAFYKGFNEQARKLDSLVKSEENRMAALGLGRFSQETRQQLAQVDASIDQTKWKMNLLYQEEKRLNQEAMRQKVGSVDFEKAWLKKDETKSARVREGERLIELEKERQRIIASDPTVQQLDRNIEQTRAKIQQLIADEKRLHGESLKQTVGSSEFERLWQQKYTVRDQRIAEQEKLIQLEKERQQLVSVDPIRTQITNTEELRAKHEKVLGVMRDETTTNNKVAQSQQEVSQATQQTTQSAQRYTEEIRKQAQAIRESQQWKEQGFARVGDKVFYDVERLQGTKKHKQEIGTLEEQILRTMQQQSVAERANTQEAQQHLDIIKRIAAEARAVMKQDGVSAYNTKYAVQNPYIYAENDARAKGLTIEQQIEQILKEQTKEYERHVEKVQQTTQKREKLAAQGVDKSFKTTLAQTLGISVDEINSTGTSIKNVTAYSKQLQKAWENLSSVGRKSPFGKQLQEELQITQMQLQRTRNEASKPISLNFVKGMTERTLDDIAYKMRQLQSYRSGLNVDTQKKEITQVNDEYNRLKKRMDEVMQKNQQMIASNTALGRSWNYMKNRLAFYFTVGASTAFVKNLIEVRSQYEMNERALGILIGSAERGTQVFQELSQMSLVSPYTLIELSSAAKQLTAYDIAAKDVVDTTRRLADMASAVGVPIERLTYALGQIKAYGYLNSRDQRMFANAGIPLVRELANYYTELEGRLVSTADVYDRIKKKAVDYNDVMQVVYQMTDEGGRFFDFQAKMADTLKVRLANLTLAWNNMLNDIGKSEQGVLTTSINSLTMLFRHWKDIEHVLGEVVVAFGAYKAYQFIITRLSGTTARALEAQVIAQKRNNIAILEREALVRKLTIAELRQIATQKQVTAADYQNALSGKALTKSKAILLASFNKNNKQLLAALVNMKLLTAAEVSNITAGKALSLVFRGIALSIKGAALAMKSFFVSNWALIALGAVYELYHAWDSYNEHIEEINKSAIEHAKEARKNIKEYLDTSVIDDIRLRNETGSLSNDEALKTWGELREQLELSSSASDVFIGKLLDIDNINERLRQGFSYLNDIEKVAGVIANMDDDTITFSSSIWGGMFGEGTKDDLKDFLDSKDAVIAAYGDMGKAAQELQKQQESSSVGIGNILYDMQELSKEVQKTTNSIYDFAEQKGFNSVQQREFFERVLSEQMQAEELGAKEVRVLRIKAEEEYYNYAKKKLLDNYDFQIKTGNTVAATRVQNEIKALEEQFGKQEALQQSFFAWLSETQASEVRRRLGNLTQQEIEHGEWMTEENLRWINEITSAFASEYGVSFNSLYNLVKTASTWSIHIPVLFDFIGQTPSDIAQDYEARTKKKMADNPVVKDARTQVDVIKKLQDEQANLANTIETARKAGGKYFQDNIKQWTERNNALVSDIHAYNALTKAEEQAQKSAGKRTSSGKKAAAAAKAEKQAESELAKTLNNEFSLINEVRGEYKKLEDAGVGRVEALDTVTKHFTTSIANINKILGKNGLPLFDIKTFVGTDNPKALLDLLKLQLEAAKKNPRVKAQELQKFEFEINKVEVDAKAYDTKKIAEGLDNSLARLKDEYELAISLDADPELGNLFADWMGIDVSVLPRTVQEYAERATKYLNKYLNGENANLEIPDILNLTSDDIRAFEEGVNTGLYNKQWVERIKKAYDEAANYRKKDMEDAVKNWNNLIQKYGDLQDQLTKIEKDAMLEQVEVIKQMGDEEQKRRAVDITRMIGITKDPEELARLTSELLSLLQAVVEKDQKGISITKAISNEKEQKTSKAYWDDFKNSNLYALTFDDMANNSTRAIQLIITKLNELKDKVKEDPASMKALMDSLQKAEEELNARNPFKAVIDGLKEWHRATKEVKQAESELKFVQQQQTLAQNAYNKALKEGDPVKIAWAQENLANATQRVKVAEEGLVNAENKAQKGLNKFKTNLSNTAQYLQQVSDGITAVEDIMKTLGGDEDTIEFIEAINSGFQKMITILMAVAAAITVIIILRTTLNSVAPELLIISAALAVIIGMIQFLDSHKNNKINKEVKKSEREVKRLETAYKNLEVAIEEAYGTMVVGAKQAAIANKELQLAELRRQLQLEQSRKKKHRDEDKIQDLKSQIIDLQNDIRKSYQEIATELLGLSSVGDAAEDMIGNFIDALRSGEDAMESFQTSVKDMVASLVKKLVVTRIIGPELESLVSDMNARIQARSKYEADAYEKAVEKQTQATSLSESEIRQKVIDQRTQALVKKGYDMVTARMMSMSLGVTQEEIEAYLDVYQQEVNRTKKELDKATTPTLEDIDLVAKSAYDMVPALEGYEDWINELLKRYDLFADTSDKQLSALQQGIQGVTEDTAGAIEAYMNGVSQQVYLQSDILTQIRDAVVVMDVDIQTATLSQMLLQLQQSYQVQMSIQNTLEGWNNASGRAVRVELVS